MEKEKKTQMRRNPPPATSEEQPLLRLLIFEATQRGETLAALAKQLGVTYERLAQWRRNDGRICNASRDVHECAARYLGLPTVLVLAMAGTVELKDFVWPGQGSLDARVATELQRLRKDPYLGGFVPAELAVAAPAVKLFVTFLFRELTGSTARQSQSYHWLRAMQLAAAGDADGQEELGSLRELSNKAPGIF